MNSSTNPAPEEKKHRRLESIERDMGRHRHTCNQAFHRWCPEFIKLGREYKAAGGVILTWDPDEE